MPSDVTETSRCRRSTRVFAGPEYGIEMVHFRKTFMKLQKALKPVSEVQKADAAVVLLMKHTHGDLEVLLVERVKSRKDPWSGQMALPGGKHDEKDSSIVQTAIRETYEETSIDLTKKHCMLGALENTRSGTRPSLFVAPFVAILRGEPAIELNEELVRYLWIQVSKLPQYRGTARLPFGEVPAYLLEGRIVWGLTYRILEKLLKILPPQPSSSTPTERGDSTEMVRS